MNFQLLRMAIWRALHGDDNWRYFHARRELWRENSATIGAWKLFESARNYISTRWVYQGEAKGYDESKFCDWQIIHRWMPEARCYDYFEGLSRDKLGKSEFHAWRLKNPDTCESREAVFEKGVDTMDICAGRTEFR